jgi:hypothetical protein
LYVVTLILPDKNDAVKIVVTPLLRHTPHLNPNHPHPVLLIAHLS